MKKVTCNLCFHHCCLQEGQVGFCKTRMHVDGEIKSLIYGKITSMALDAIEKKPFQQFYPGSKILSVGSSGCSMRCPFCQNYQISMETDTYSRMMTPEELINIALELKEKGNIGLAFTYNEPMLSFEYMKDCFQLAKQKGLKTAIISNGMIEESYLKQLLPYVDAMNIDLKCFYEQGYQWLQGSFEQVKHTIAYSYPQVHVEITSLIVPGLNDDIEDMRQQCQWIASLDPTIPLHISRYFPAYHMHQQPTDLQVIHDLVVCAKQYLKNVYKGNC